MPDLRLVSDGEEDDSGDGGGTTYNRIVELLEDVLERAKAGDVCGIAIVSVRPDRGVRAERVYGSSDAADLVIGLQALNQAVLLDVTSH